MMQDTELTEIDGKSARRSASRFLELVSGSAIPVRREFSASSEGKICSTVYVAHDVDIAQTAFLYPEPDGSFSGWRFRDPTKQQLKAATEAQPIACVASK